MSTEEQSQVLRWVMVAAALLATFIVLKFVMGLVWKMLFYGVAALIALVIVQRVVKRLRA